MRQPSLLDKRHRLPGEIISHAVWLSDRFLLSNSEVEELLAARGIAVSYETIRRWCKQVGQTFSDGVRRRRPRPGDKWHVDEVQLKSNGRRHWLWRAVDQEGRCWTSSSSSGATRKRPRRSYGAWWTAPKTRRGWWSPTSSRATRPRSRASCRMRCTGGPRD